MVGRFGRRSTNVKAFYNGKTGEQIAKRNRRMQTPTPEQTLRKQGAYNRGREWFALPKWSEL